jgi:hypothetical protein
VKSLSTKVTYIEYYKAFGSVRGIAAVVTAAVPLTSEYVFTGLVFPPLGDESIWYRILATAIAVAITALVWRHAQSISGIVANRWKLALLVATMLFGCAYGVAHFAFVRRIDWLDEKRSEYVSIGYHRTPGAALTYAGMSDLDILKARGYLEPDVRENWTLTSIVVARLALFASFCGAAFSAVAVLSFYVLDLAGERKLHDGST